jgi:hypothetical protein
MRPPANWLETTLTDEKAIVEKYYKDHLEVHDADQCGSGTYFFAFSTGKFFKLYHSWYIETEPEWNIVSEIDIEEVAYGDIPEANRILCQDRDYLKIKPSSYTQHQYRHIEIPDDDVWRGIKL